MNLSIRIACALVIALHPLPAALDGGARSANGEPAGEAAQIVRSVGLDESAVAATFTAILHSQAGLMAGGLDAAQPAMIQQQGLRYQCEPDLAAAEGRVATERWSNGAPQAVQGFSLNW